MKTSAVVGSNLQNLFHQGKEAGYAGGLVAAEKAGALKEKIQSKQWGTKVMGMFKKKQSEAPGTMENEAEEEEKKEE